jgi:hypothetical protein
MSTPTKVDMNLLLSCAFRLAESMGLRAPSSEELLKQSERILADEKLVEAVDRMILFQREAATAFLARMQTWLLRREHMSHSEVPDFDDPGLEERTEIALFGKLGDPPRYE